MTALASIAEFQQITLTRERYVWRPRYVCDPWPPYSIEQRKREIRRELLTGKGPRLARDRIGIAEQWLTRKLKRMGYQVIPGFAHEIQPDPPGWRTPGYCVHAFKKPDELTWDDAERVGRFPYWRKRPSVELALPVEVSV